MYKHLFLATVVIAVSAVQLANSTECYTTCNDPNTCKSASKEICDDKTAVSTRNEIGKYFKITSSPSKDFECVKLIIADPNIEIQGCIYSSEVQCDLSAVDNSPHKIKECSVCPSGNCNDNDNDGDNGEDNAKSPASAITAITAISLTMISAVLSSIFL